MIEKITTYKLKTKYVLMVEKIYNNIFYIGKTTSVYQSRNFLFFT